MSRVALLLVLLLVQLETAHASTYRCHGTSADQAGMNAALAGGGYVYFKGDLAACKQTGTLLGTVAGTVLFGDGPAHQPAADPAGRARQTARGLLGTAQVIVPTSGPATVIAADVATMRATPFTLLAVTAQPFYVRDLSFDGAYDQIATVNTPGNGQRGVSCSGEGGSSFNADGSVTSVGGVTFDHVDVRNIGGSSYYFDGGHDCAVINSVSQTTWGSAAYATNSSGTYLLGDVFADSSRAATYGSSFSYFDQVGLDPNHTNAVIAQTTDLGGDRLHNSSINKGTPGGPDFDFQNYSDNTSTTPTCYTLGMLGTPVAGEQFTLTASLTSPSGASPATIVYPPYTATSADASAADPLYSVMQALAAAMNANPLSAGGVALQTFAWQAGHAPSFTHALEWRMPGNLLCIAHVTLADTGTPPLTLNPGKAGNGSGGCATHNGNNGPGFDVQNYCYQSRAYCDVVGGATVNMHIVENVCDGVTAAGIKAGTGINDGSPDGGESGMFLLMNKFMSPDSECGGGVDCVNHIYATISAKCGVWTFTGQPQQGEVLTITQSSPGASNSPQTYTYTVSPQDAGAVGPIVSLANNIATGYNSGALGGAPLSIGGSPISALEQSSNEKQTNPAVQFSLRVPGACTETLSYTDIVPSGGVGNISITNKTGVAASGVLGGVAYGNVGGTQVYPPNSTLFWSAGNVQGAYP